MTVIVINPWGSGRALKYEILTLDRVRYMIQQKADKINYFPVTDTTVMAVAKLLSSRQQRSRVWTISDNKKKCGKAVKLRCT